MKSFRYLLPALALLASSVAAGPIGDPLRGDSVSVTYESPAAITKSTACIVIDRSDTTNWPHKHTGNLEIYSLSGDLDMVWGTTATIRLGLLTSVTDTSGTVKYFWAKDVVSSSGTANQYSWDLPAGALRADIDSSGNALYFLTNISDTNSTTYQNDVTLPTANSTYVVPAAGDIILQVIGDAVHAVRAKISVLYRLSR